jgi:hypothetical protein
MLRRPEMNGDIGRKRRIELRIHGQCALRLWKLSNVRKARLLSGWPKVCYPAPLCFGEHDKPFFPAVFSVVTAHYLVGYDPFLWVIHKKGLCPISADINSLWWCTLITQVVMMIRLQTAFHILSWQFSQSNTFHFKLALIISRVFWLDDYNMRSIYKNANGLEGS